MMSVSSDEQKCLACGGCVSVCPQDALTLTNMKIACDPKKCNSCTICIRFCPVGALSVVHPERAK